MLSARNLAIFALIATAVALPATDKPIPEPITSITNDDFVPVMPAPWFSVPYFGDITKIFAPLWKLFPSFEDLGPRILADDHEFKVIVQVKDYAKDDLKVKVKRDFIFVQGTHEAKQQDHDLFASQFFHTYTLPENSTSADVTAELTSDGYLIVTAPISADADKSKEVDRVVPIVETGAPYNKEAPETPEESKVPEVLAAPKAPEVPEVPVAPEVLIDPDTPVATEAPVVPEITTAEQELVSEEDRKEPTTPETEREEVTENDNVIPHGSDLKP